MFRIYYYRYDQDYLGWELWIWQKGHQGSLYMFNTQEYLDSDVEKSAMVAEIDVSGFENNELGIIIRRGGWHERDYYLDRHYLMPEKAKTDTDTIYIVQDTAEVFTSTQDLKLLPGFEEAIFNNFREIYVCLQAPSKVSLKENPFEVFQDGISIPIRQVTPIRGSREFIISLAKDMQLGSSYKVYKPDFKEGYVDYGVIYDTPQFTNTFTYDKDDLGATYSPELTTFKVWAPVASSILLNLYSTGSGQGLINVVEMTRRKHGVWEAQVDGDLSGIYYTYNATNLGKTYEAADPYAHSSGVNGRRSMVVNPDLAKPDGWDEIKHKPLVNPTDAVLYEAHVRDMTIHPSSGVENPGKYLGLAEKGSRSPENLPTGLSHLVNLGITHVHLMPVFDFFTVDESMPLENQYNWGYDPTNYNVPEGSYATDQNDGYTRVMEFKQMVKAIKESGIGVVMDVVYNHTYKTYDSDFNKLVPGYYYRRDQHGNFSNGSGCGNEVASERSMVRKFILTSVKRWASDYKIDGFRFDLMGLTDIETMNDVRLALDKISPSIILYGEGWTGGASQLKGYEAATKTNAPKLNRIGFFNDNTRDAIKGDNFHSYDTGFVTGNYRYKEGVKFGVVGAIFHPAIDYTKVNYSGHPWASYSWHCVNYVASHDNLTLYDKLIASRPDLSKDEHARLVNFASSVILTSQGIPFLMLGIDMMRSKKGEHNSYNLPDEINQIDWSLKYENQQVFNYHKGLIELRKAHPAFRMVSSEEIRRNIRFYPSSDWVVSFSINNYANNDTWKTIFVAYNAGNHNEIVYLPKNSNWTVVVDDLHAGTEPVRQFKDNKVELKYRSTTVLYLDE